MTTANNALLGDGSSLPRGLIQLAKNHAKLGFDVWQGLKLAILRAGGIVDYPVPPNSTMRSTSSRTIRHYFESGIRTSTPIITAASIHGIDLSGNCRVLDFGCGVGRQLLHFTANLPNLSLFACDVNARSIAYIRKTFPQVDCHVNDFQPPLRYEDRTFDLIYSVSIFSHLTYADQAVWLSELARVLRDDGLCCLTVMGRHALDRWPGFESQERAVAQQALAEQGSYYKGAPKPQHQRWVERISKFGSNLVGIDADYGDTFYSAAYICEKWNNANFSVLSVVPGVIDNLQDLVVLKRRPRAESHSAR
ncbi:MAG TPA: class I SAM-dependent methyltransferase [Rhodocyclaceae bacterium]|nr:class I SAM-dependent methyltransferase [Rhodocyclaceae bacterium]